MKKHFTSLILVIWKVVFNPVTVISVVSLLVHNNTVISIRAELGIPYNMSSELIDSSKFIVPELKQLGHILNNPWNYAMNDLIVQGLILLVATILAIYQFLNGILPIMPYAFKDSSNKTKLNSAITRDFWSVLFATISAIVFIYVAYMYFGNKSANLFTLKLYLPDSGIITGETRYPPWDSAITQCRYLISTYGAISAIYFNYHFEKVLSKAKNSEKVL